VKRKLFVMLAYIIGRRRMVRMLMKLDNLVNNLISVLAMELEPDGLHPKHRLTRYHDFFAQAVRRGDTCLDIGCGNGALLYDVVRVTDAPAYGVELDAAAAKAAQERFRHDNRVAIVAGDIRDVIHKGLPLVPDVIIMSNVLEHLDDRAGLLRELAARFPNARMLIRVPQKDREWLVLYKDEHGVDSRLDATHRCEYRREELLRELADAGYHVEEHPTRWGEHYVVATVR
jgi:2-polyprenyl-3-methyl-5-hydroxy-6-metoxy-1,4-benzoquinol methylase